MFLSIIVRNKLNFASSDNDSYPWNIFVFSSTAELSEIYTHIDLMPVLEAAGIGGAEDNHTVDVKEPEVLQAADEFLVQENLPVLKDSRNCSGVL